MNIRSLGNRWWLITIGMVLLLSIPFIYVISQYSEYDFIQLISIFNAISSLILTFILAYLYQGLGIIQKRQTEIMEKNHIPNLELDSTAVIGYGTKWGPHFAIVLSNTGKGNISNLRLEISPSFVLGYSSFELKETTHELTRSSPENAISDGNEVSIQQRGNYLRSDTNAEKFYAQASFDWIHEDSGGGTNYLSSLAISIASRINPDIYEVDPDTTEVEEYEPTNYATIGGRSIPISSEEDLDRFGDLDHLIEIEKRQISEYPTEEALREKVNEILDDNLVRFECELKYNTESGETKHTSVYDKFIEVREGLTFAEMIRAGVDCETIEDSEYDEILHSFRANAIRETRRDY